MNRIAYNFTLVLPDRFTMRDLRKTRHDVKYITAYMRVQKALKAGEIKIVGKEEPKTKRKGARQLIYQRVNAKTATVASPAVA